MMGRRPRRSGMLRGGRGSRGGREGERVEGLRGCYVFDKGSPRRDFILRARESTVQRIDVACSFRLPRIVVVLRFPV